MEQVQLEEVFKSLTIEEKIGQLVQLNGNFFDSNEKVVTGPVTKIGIDKDKIYLTGSILNTMGAKELKVLQDKYLADSKKKIPMLFMADIINGFKTIFPIPLGLGCTFNPELVKMTAKVAAREAAVSGIHITFSPMVDMVKDARWGRVMESYGEDNYLNCEYATAMVEGYQGDKNPESTIMACVKHFAAYGAPVAGREYNTVELGERSLRQEYLPAYKAAVDAGCELVMTSFNTIDGIPVTANEWVLRDILRKEWQFNGVVISDHSAVKELVPHGIAKDTKEAARLAMLAGCDIDMMTATYSNHLKELVETGALDIAYIDEAVMRILELKNKLGLFENPYRGGNEKLEKEVVMCDDFRKFSREVVSKTCVLLKNDTVLPLNAKQKIALIGPYASNPNLSGMWSFNVDTSKVITVLSGFKEYSELVESAKGSPLLDDASMFESFGYSKNVGSLTSADKEKELQEAITIAKEAEVIVVAIGEHSHQSGEGGARGDITIPDVQLNLLKEMKKLGKPVVTLVFSGRPLALKEVADNSDAVLQCWFPGTEGGAGIADVIYGKENPSARLSMTFPYSVGQCPIYYNQMSTGRPATTSSHSKRFTSRYIDIPNDPYYCFGYGLSYSEFEYSEIQLDTHVMNTNSSIVVSVDVKNTTNVAGEETVQLYIRDLFGSVVRPVKELKGIQKVSLQGKETKKVSFTIDESMLRFIRKDMQYASELGEFEVFVGHDSSTENKMVFTLES